MRTAEPADASAVARLVNAAFRPERFFIDADRTNPEKVGALLQKGKFLMHLEDGVLAGCVYVELRGERGYFGLLAVDPQRSALRNRGAADRRCRTALPYRRMPVRGSHLREFEAGTVRLLPAIWLCRERHLALPSRSGRQGPRPPRADVEAAIRGVSLSACPPKKKPEPEGSGCPVGCVPG